MMGDTFWMVFWSLFAVVIITFSSLVYMNVTAYDKMVQDRYVKCLDSGGSWIPSQRNEAICLRK